MKNKSWRKQKTPYFGKAKLFEYKFSNGLTVLVSPNKVAPVFSFQTWFNVGSRDEEAGKSGLAHLFEHMMFKGTKKNPQGVFDRTMESSGARDLNAFTSTDYTAYVSSLPIKHLPLVAALESDRMVGLAITEEQFVSEREVVRNERKQRTDNNPEGVMFEELQKAAFARHPYGRPVIGFEADLDAMTTVDCEDFYHAYYAPNNAIISVVGQVDPDKVAAAIEKAYAQIPASQLKRGEVAKEPEQKVEKRLQLSLPVQVEKAYVAYKIPPATHHDQAALAMVSSILSSGRSSRFYQALVDKGITLDISTSPHAAKDEGLFYMSYSCQPGKKAEDALKIIDQELQQVADKGVLPEELERAKNKLRTETFQGLSTNSAQANFLGQSKIVLGSIEAALAEWERMENMELAEVQAAARRYLIPDRRTVVMGVPA